MIKSYVNSVQESSYEIGYMKDQRKNRGLSKVINQKTSINYFKDLRHNIGMLIKKKYNPINPYMLNIFSRILIIHRRKNNLIDKIIYAVANTYYIHLIAVIGLCIFAKFYAV